MKVEDDDMGHDGYPPNQSCGRCIWRGGWDEGPGRLGAGVLQYCHHPDERNADGKPKDQVYHWMGCNKQKSFPKGDEAREYVWDWGDEQ
jgi:hypothetical protein